MRGYLRRLVGLGLLAVGVALSAPASAADCSPAPGISTCVDADNLWVHAGAGPFLSIGAPTTTPDDRVSFSLVLSYLSRPIVLRVASPDPKGTAVYAIDNALDATVLLGLGVTDRLELSLAAPLTLLQDGDGLRAATGTTMELPRSAMKDLRLGMAFAFLAPRRAGDRNGFLGAGRLEFALPTATPGVFAGGPTMTIFPTATFGYRKGAFEVDVETGARLRGTTTLAGVPVGSQHSFALGATYDVLPQKLLTASAEVFALAPFASNSAAAKVGAPVPAEWIASVTSAPFLAGDIAVTLGGGGPIPFSSTPALTDPRFRFDLALRYAPSGRDTDGDGIPDFRDKCPAIPEDKDGFQDADGCPDPDNDKDGIPDSRDKCPNEAEDFDGFQDADGCPDLDDDKDGVPDSTDKCRGEAEDKDGFQDADGCPDPDNDGDGIPDSRDKCPNEPEDKDGFQDADGCPDPDNDGDGIPDSRDKCPNVPEDKDGFEDADGCPDPDNDHDGVLDADDKCPLVPETINGVADDDGCPEPGAHSLVAWAGPGKDQVVVEQAVRFAAGSATAPKELAKQVRMMGQLVRGRTPLERVLVEAEPDRPGDPSPRAQMLAGNRAAAIKALLVGAGIPEDRIIAAAAETSTKRGPDAPPFTITVQKKAPDGQRR